MAAVRRPERERFWREKLAHFERSGSSLNAFCRQESINRHTFKSWIFVIKGRDGAEARRQLKSKRNPGNPLSPDEKARRLSVQQAVIRRWRESGLTQAEFCRLEGIREQQLSNWKRQVTKSTVEELPAATEKESESPWSIRNFVPVSVPSTANDALEAAPETSAATSTGNGKKSSSAASPTHRGGVVICVFSGADLNTLRSLFAAIKESWSC